MLVQTQSWFGAIIPTSCCRNSLIVCRFDHAAEARKINDVDCIPGLIFCVLNPAKAHGSFAEAG